TTRKSYVGKVLNYCKEIEVAHILIESGQIKTNDELLIMGETTGVLELKLETMKVNDNEDHTAKRGDEITFRVPALVRRNDRVYLIEQIK
ncbi:MAG TPA: U32 family peptidase, partial [Ignavibacteriaceae bacterium]|nr:U32 family peptidase [Ignavibacteriaceae bacterium]